MIAQENELAEETVRFFKNVQVMAGYNIPARFFERKRFTDFLDETFALLFNDTDLLLADLIDTTKQCVAISGTDGKKDAFDLLITELRFFNSRYNYLSTTTYFPHLDEIKPKEKFEGAITALDSINELLDKLPAWLKNIFKIIKEILGFAKLLY